MGLLSGREIDNRSSVCIYTSARERERERERERDRRLSLASDRIFALVYVYIPSPCTRTYPHRRIYAERRGYTLVCMGVWVSRGEAEPERCAVIRRMFWRRERASQSPLLQATTHRFHGGARESCRRRRRAHARAEPRVRELHAAAAQQPLSY